MESSNGGNESVNGQNQNDWLGVSISSAGDINGDGFDDILIGANKADPRGINSAGESYVIFGRDFRNERIAA